MATKEQYQATLVGCAIGDTLGMAVEGWKREQIQKYVPGGRIVEPIAPLIVRDVKGNLLTEDEFGKIKYYTRDLQRGEYTDDTILTVAIAESIVGREELDLDDLCQRQLKAYEACRMPSGRVKGGFGGTTKDAFENLKKGKFLFDCGVYPGLGNGPVMKISPLALYGDASGLLKRGLDNAVWVAQATHKDTRAIASAPVQVEALYSLLRGDSREIFLERIVDVCKAYEKHLPKKAALSEKGTLLSKLEWVVNNQNLDCEDAFRKLGNSALAFESYPFTLFMFQKYFDNPIEGLIETVNFGGDCDTTGAIFGTLAGAKHGMIFPQAWLDILKNRQHIANLGEKLFYLKNKRFI